MSSRSPEQSCNENGNRSALLLTLRLEPLAPDALIAIKLARTWERSNLKARIYFAENMNMRVPSRDCAP